MIRILVADDHAIVREGLKLIIGESPDMNVTGEAGNGAETLKKVSTGAYDLVLLDISMPDLSGLDVLCKIKMSNPRLPVLVLSMFPEGQYAIRAIKQGACGYITKEEAAQNLIGAIRKVARGGRYVTPRVADTLVESMMYDTGLTPLHANLSRREKEVMIAIASGLRPSRIARDMGISAKTVSTYRSRLLKKMGMSNDAELIRYAIRHDLVNL
jgi:two-component system invasion response regulator UvrY